MAFGCSRHVCCGARLFCFLLLFTNHREIVSTRVSCATCECLCSLVSVAGKMPAARLLTARAEAVRAHHDACCFCSPLLLRKTPLPPTPSTGPRSPSPPLGTEIDNTGGAGVRQPDTGRKYTIPARAWEIDRLTRGEGVRHHAPGSDPRCIAGSAVRIASLSSRNHGGS